MRNGWKKRLMIGSCMAMLGLCLVWGLTVWRSAQDYRTATGYFKSKDYVRAITFFDRALHWYSPFNPYIERSSQGLWDIAETAKKNGDMQLERIALGSIQGGFFAARSFYSPGVKWIEQARSEIARLEATKDEGKNSAEPKPHDFPRRRKDPAPDVFWSIVLEIGLWGWIGSVIGFLIQAVDSGEKPRLLPGPALRWAGWFVFFYAVWIAGMTRA